MLFDLTPGDSSRLLRAVLQQFQAPEAYVSLEGGLSDSRLQGLERATDTETNSLVRNTLTPRLDFVIAPLTAVNVDLITRAVEDENLLGEMGSLIHLQVSVGDQLVFGAYDNFHPDCVFVIGLSVPQLEDMRDARAIVDFRARAV